MAEYQERRIKAAHAHRRFHSKTAFCIRKDTTMSSMDIIPIWSQGKAFLQWITGDIEGALRTQVNFSQYCPFVSQACSLVQLSQGNKKGALETQIQFVSGVGDVLNAVPIIGHTKGVIHYVCSDKNGGHRAMKSASRTFVVMTGGAIGFGMGGPAGAAAGGVVGGAVTDGIITSVGSKFHGEYRPAGIFDQAAKLVNNPKDAGQWVDIVGTVAFDALTGYAQGEWMKNESQAKAVAEGKVKREGQQQTETGNMMKTEAEPYTPHDEIPYIEPILLDNNQVEFVSADTVNACVGGASITSIMMAKGEEKQVDKKENKKEDEKQPHDPSSLHIRQASSKLLPTVLCSIVTVSLRFLYCTCCVQMFLLLSQYSYASFVHLHSITHFI